MIRSWAVVGALGLAAFAGSVFVASSPSYAAGPHSHRATLSVSPSSQLLPGAQVSFSGSGFPPGLALLLEECDPDGPISKSRCTTIGDSLFLSGPDGSISGSGTIVSGPVGATADTSCPVRQDRASDGSCMVTLMATDGSRWYGATPISFSPSVRVPADPPPTTLPTAQPAPGALTPSTAPVGDGPVATGTKPADARKAVPMSAPAATAGRGSPFDWPVWLVVMAGAAAVTGALRGARARRRGSRAPGPTVR